MIALGVLLLAADVSLVVTPSKTDVTVGETFEVTVEAKGPPGTAYTFPPEIAAEKIELRPKPDPRPDASRGPARETYEAAVFALSDVAIPPVKVSYRLPDGTTGEAASEPVALHVGSLLPRDSKDQQLVDIKPPVPLGIDRAFYIAAALLAAAIGLLAYWLWRRRRPAPTAAPALPPTPPDIVAVAALDRLQASGLLAREEYRPFYIELTEIAKRYLEARLGAPILEMTTAETIAFLRDDSRCRGFVELVRDLSGAADQIKFARGQGAQEMAERHLQSVRGLVATLESMLRPAPTVPAATVVASGRR